MNPWEETWSADSVTCNDASCITLEEPNGCTVIGGFAGDERRTHLAAAAPELYRALVKLEWSGDPHTTLECPECEFNKREGHHESCALNAALKKARGE